MEFLIKVDTVNQDVPLYKLSSNRLYFVFLSLKIMC